MINKGVTVCVICPNREGIYYGLKKDGIEVHVFPYRNSCYPSYNSFRKKMLFVPRICWHWLLNLRAKHVLCKLCNVLHPDIIHSNVGVINIGYRVACQLHIPHIYHLREYQNLDFDFHVMPSMRQFKKQLLNPNSYTICITEGIKRHFDLFSQNAIVLYNGFEQNRMEKSTCIIHKKPYILFAGRLEVAKGIEDAIYSFSEFRIKCKMGTNYELWVAGDATDMIYFKYIQKLTSKLNVKESVRFLGMQSDIKVLLQNAAFLIMASNFEAFGRITVEAMLSGCLVIGRDTAGTKEQFDNGVRVCGREIGLRFNTSKELSDRMVEVINNGIENYYDMICSAQQTVHCMYNAEKYVNGIYEFYEHILQGEKTQAYE
jgi:glycosyltransferase involved in cell wall biosynthesis